MKKQTSLQLNTVFKTWWPLAASWILMAVELPVMSAVIARMAAPKVNLAAFGSIAFIMAFVIFSPIEMLLAASTALSKDSKTYNKIKKFALTMCSIVMGVHILIAATPLFYVIAENVIHAPAEVIEPARMAFILLTPVGFMMGYRRFQQGVLIRFGRSNAIGVGTGIRLVTDVVVLLLGYFYSDWSGAMVAAAAQASGVFAELVYTLIVVRPVVKNDLAQAEETEPLSWTGFLKFYIPLATTTVIMFSFEFIASTAISRMPMALESLAVWPVISGLIFLLESPGVALNEVVVALLDRHEAVKVLRRFTTYVAGGMTILMLVIMFSPLAVIWVRDVSSLPQELVQMAMTGLWFLVPLPFLATFMSWFQGSIVFSRKTRSVTESIFISLCAFLIILIPGVLIGKFIGLYVGTIGFVFSVSAQMFWLGYRSRGVIKRIEEPEPAIV